MLLSQKLHEAGNTEFYLPAAKIPGWFDLPEPPCSFWFRNKFPAIAICLVWGSEEQYCLPEVEDEDQDDYYLLTDEDLSVAKIIVIINGSKHLVRDQWMEPNATILFDMQVMEHKGYLDKALLENEWNHAEIIFVNQNYEPIPIKGRIHVLKQKSSMEDIRFTDPCRKKKIT